MSKITKENIEDYASKLMFKMKDEEYPAFEKEFETIIKHMNLIGNIKDLDKVEPMTFPYINKDACLRKDEVKNILTTDDAIKNAHETIYDEVKVPKIVGGDD